MFTSTSNYARLMRVFVLSAFLAVFSSSLAPTVAASPGLFDSTWDTAGRVDTHESSLSHGTIDTTDIVSDASPIEAPKVDKWVSRPLKQFNPFEVVEGTKMIKRPGRSDPDRTGYMPSKPSLRLAKAI